MKQRNLILVRHGQSEWNEKNLFTGWENPGLTQKGEKEAKDAGKIINSLGINFDYLYTSALIRAQLTGSIILSEINQKNVNTIENKALNERFYGDLQGLNKDECRKKWGDEKVQMWRRSYDQGPPGGETLKQTGERVVPYFREEIEPLVKNGSNILIAAHGNSLRAIMIKVGMYKPEEISSIELPTGSPLCLDYDNGKLKQNYYLD